MVHFMEDDPGQVLQGFEEHFRLFCDTVEGIRAGTFTEEDMDRQRGEVWMNPYLLGAEPLDQLAVYNRDGPSRPSVRPYDSKLRVFLQVAK